jgi:hypothetical protein
MRAFYPIDAFTFSKSYAHIIERLQRLFSDFRNPCHHLPSFLEMKRFSKRPIRLKKRHISLEC